MNKIERVCDVEFRSNETDARTVEGYAVVFNSVADLGWFTEEIDPHAFISIQEGVHTIGNFKHHLT